MKDQPKATEGRRTAGALMRRCACILAFVAVFAQSTPGGADEILADVQVVKVLDSVVEIPGFGQAGVELGHYDGDTLLLTALGHGDGQGTGLFLYDGAYTAIAATGMTLPDAPERTVQSAYGSSLNAAEVAVVFDFDNGQRALYRYQRGSGHFTRLVDTDTAVPDGTGTFSAFYNATIDGGVGVFYGIATNGARGIYRWDGALTRLADYATSVPGGTGTFSHLSSLTFRDGIVAFIGRDSAGLPGVYRSHNGGALTRVADTSTGVPGTPYTFDHFGQASVHDGTVFFTGFGGFVAGVYGGEEATTTLADTRMPMPGAFGPFDCCFATPLRGAPGNYYFRASNLHTHGIYLARGSAVYKIIDDDEPLDGEHPGVIEFGVSGGGQSLDDRLYFKTYGGIYSARPSFAPAPAPAPRITLDFEGLDLVEGGLVTSIPGVPSVAVDGAVLVRPAPPDTAFPGDDGGTGDMLTAASPDAALITVVFDAPVHALTLDIANVVGVWPLQHVELRVYDAEAGGTLLETIVAQWVETMQGGPGTVAPVDFSFGFAGVDRIRRLEIRGPVAAALPGYAIDNLAFASDTLVGDGSSGRVVVPFPPAMLLLGALCIGVLGWRYTARP